MNKKTVYGGASKNVTGKLPECRLPRCPVTGELKPHRNAAGVPTFKVRVVRL